MVLKGCLVISIHYLHYALHSLSIMQMLSPLSSATMKYFNYAFCIFVILQGQNLFSEDHDGKTTFVCMTRKIGSNIFDEIKYFYLLLRRFHSRKCPGNSLELSLEELSRL